jgi:Mn2+/Fe2+ NRAMP family transporter
VRSARDEDKTGPEAAGQAAEPWPRLSHEDLDRAADRSRVFWARRHRHRWQLLWLLIGPGVLAMIGENDGPSMISYATSGATFGYGFFLPFIALTFAAAIVCQEMCMRVGAVTHRGYGELVIQRYGKVWGWFNAGDLVLTNLVTLVAEFVALRVGLAYFNLPSWVAVVLGLALVAFAQSGHRYWRWERISLGLAMFNGLFLVAALMVKPDWAATGRAFVTLSPFPGGSVNTILLLIASTIGATVTPWMIFFQQSATVDKGMTPSDIREGRSDTVIGGVLAGVFGCGAFVVGAVLAAQHAGNVQGLAGAGFPAALQHSSGSAAATVLALGLIEAGALALLTISASTGYAVGEALGVHHSFNYSIRRAGLFYVSNIGAAIIAGLVILIPGAPLLSIALNANILATVLLPVALVFLLLLANDRTLMGSWANSRPTNVAATIVVVIVAVCGAAYAIDSFLIVTHVIGP